VEYLSTGHHEKPSHEEIDIEQRIGDRKAPRQNKDWALSDSTTKEREKEGILVEDGKEGRLGM